MKVAKYAFLIFFALSLSIPTALPVFRGFYLGILLLLLFFRQAAGADRWRVNRSISIVFGAMLMLSIFYVCYGVYNGFPEAVQLTTVYVLWPTMYWYVLGFGYQHRDDIARALAKTIVVGILIATILCMLFALADLFSPLQVLSPMFALLKGNVAENEGRLVYSSAAISTQIFGAAYLPTILLFPRSIVREWYGRRFYLFTLATYLLLIASLLLTSRRALWLVALLAIPIGIVLHRFAGARGIIRKGLVVLALAVVIAAIVNAKYLNVSWDTYAQRFAAGFDFGNTDDESSWARAQQFQELITGWTSHPVLGTGFGGHVEMIRTEGRMSWAYELSYVALLFHTGVIGVLAYGGTFTWVLYQLFRAVRRRRRRSVYLIPLLAGVICFLIANSTNPYLDKFDFLWVLFLPIAYVNWYRVEDATAFAAYEQRNSGSPVRRSPAAGVASGKWAAGQ